MEFEVLGHQASFCRSILGFRSSKYRKVIVGGWDLPEFWYTVFSHRKSKNCMVLESTIYESKISL